MLLLFVHFFAKKSLIKRQLLHFIRMPTTQYKYMHQMNHFDKELHRSVERYLDNFS